MSACHRSWRRQRASRPQQAGSTTVLALVFLTLVGVAVLLVTGLAALLVAHRTAAAAADLAALAGASAAQHGLEPCARVAAVATANGSVVVHCRVVRDVVETRVAVGVAGPFERRWEVEAWARSGPAGPFSSAVRTAR